MQEYIVIQGARENNLKNISLKIPKRKITIFTGVSGSGKSSIVFDTISTEAQRQLNETFTFFVRNLLPKYSQPDADVIENLSTTIVIDQKRLGGNSRSTVGTITDVYSLLRLLFSRLGHPHHGYAYAFSFNDPGGMCPECSGIGKKVGLDLEKFLDTSKSLNEGAILFPVFAVGTWYWNSYAYSGLFDRDKKLKDYSAEEWEMFLYGKDKKFDLKTEAGAFKITYEGVVEKFNRLYIKRDISALAESTRKKLEPFMSSLPCTACKGTRLNQSVLASRINGYNIADYTAMEVRALVNVVNTINHPATATVVNGIVTRLQHLVSIGLGYLSLDRETTTLSGGESQRIKMVKHLTSNLTDMIYVFDEPSIGLHPRDVHRLNELLRKLRDKGNTVLVVEHDPDVIAIADHIVDVGPHAGTRGGQIVFEGSFEELLSAPTLTGKYLKHVTPLKNSYRISDGCMEIKNASLHNLRQVTVNIPKGVLTVVTGVAGSGKSSLINHVFLKKHPDAIVIDQSAVSSSIRSNPATYTGVMDDIRQLFAQANKVSASLFSFNSKGACDNCQGIGFIYTDLAFLEPIKTPCEICNGKRFKEEVLRYTFKDRSIAEVLAMTISEALQFFDKKELKHRLQAIHDVGLHYLTLGQPLSTLSGGECQRIKIATELHKQGGIYVMDEPTTGLHMSDIGLLMRIINRMADQQNSVIVIEHNLEVIKQADWIIDMGPDGGNNGGQVVFEGTPAQLIEADHSITGTFLRSAIGQ
ncbi:ATP-binding cassette domain-containing protein [Chryseosolibacter histidini]|nr:excinuclease ABC subunit UvrA [Chryseosolibacter histidini]